MPAPRLTLSAVLTTVALLLVGVVGAVSAAPAGASTGPDVSKWQHGGGAAINWAAVHAAGNDFAFVKATEGAYGVVPAYTNPYFAGDFAGVQAVGMVRGAYHFARPSLPLSSALDQARYYVSVTGPLHGPRDLPPVLDLEQTGGLGPADLTAWVHTWLNEVQRLVGRPPMIYTSRNFWLTAMANNSGFGANRLWYALWTPNADPGTPPASWSTWTFWQYTDVGSIPGIPGAVDISRFCCGPTLAALADGTSGSAAFGNPFGNAETFASRPGGYTVGGWVIDPDTTSPIGVDVWTDGHYAGHLTANDSRPDVGAAWPGWGSKHGYSLDLPAPPGDHTVCVYAINVSTGNANTGLGCRVVHVGGNPVGALQQVVGTPGGARLLGYAIDLDTTAAIGVDVWVDGGYAGHAVADRTRPDVGAAYPAYGPGHGYDIPLTLTAGTHQVCTYAINVGPGNVNPQLGCRSITFDANPLGGYEAASATPTSVRVQGWTLDPDTADPIAVHVYVDGVFRGQALANGSRPDVAAYFAGWGAAHGFDVTVPAPAGPHQVCVFAINAGPGTANTLLGCRAT